MLVYRLAKEKFIRDLLGAGARLYGGRWNRKGTPMLYTSEYCSLALLELIVHTPPNLLPDDMCLLTLFITDDIRIGPLQKDSLPKNWRQYPAPDSLAEKGTRWINSQKTLAVRVPSVLVPNEWNILINPDHPNVEKINVESISTFRLDSRF